VQLSVTTDDSGVGTVADSRCDGWCIFQRLLCVVVQGGSGTVTVGDNAEFCGLVARTVCKDKGPYCSFKVLRCGNVPKQP
jgi:hypothetical protein